MTLPNPDQPIPSVKELTPRRGLVPFKQDVDIESFAVHSDNMPAGQLGKVFLRLQTVQDLDESDLQEGEDMQKGFTLDPNGNVVEKPISDFEGYYSVVPVILISESSKDPISNLRANIWIDGQSSTATVDMDTAPLGGSRLSRSLAWHFENQEGREGSGIFCLPRENSLLRKVRMNFSKEYGEVSN